MKHRGTPFREWANHKMTPNEITTARVFLIVGAVLGVLLGISASGLVMLIFAML